MAAAVDKMTFLEIASDGIMVFGCSLVPDGSSQFQKMRLLNPINAIEILDFIVTLCGTGTNTGETRGSWITSSNTFATIGGTDVFVGTINPGPSPSGCGIPWAECDIPTQYGTQVTDLSWNDVQQAGLMCMVNYETNIKTVLTYNCAEYNAEEAAQYQSATWKVVSQEAFFDYDKLPTAEMDDNGCIAMNLLDDVTEYACPVYVDECGIYFTTIAGEKSYFNAGENLGVGTDNPLAPFHVAKQMRYSDGLPVQGYHIVAVSNDGDMAWAPDGVVKSPDGATWQLTVNNAGTVSATQLAPSPNPAPAP